MKKAFCLSGGGAKGAFQIGVLKQLFNGGITPDVIYGTSVGALNGACVAYAGVDRVKEEWLSIKKRSDILSFNYSSLIGLSSGIYNMKPLRRDFIDEVIQGDITPTIEAKVCRVNLENGAKEMVSNFDFPNSQLDEFRDAVQDSCTIPVAMSPRDKYVDGGIRDVLPLEEAIKDGCDEIIIILCNPWKRNFNSTWKLSEKPKFLRMLWLAMRATEDIMNLEVLYNDIHATAHKIKNIDKVSVYMPPHYLYDTLDFDHKKIVSAIELGEIAQPIPLADILEI